MFFVKIPYNNYTFCYLKLIFEKLNMPKYAVAVGRKVGIYDTYNECKLQVVNYPNAKFKKFDTVQDAEAFIKKYAVKPINIGNLSLNAICQSAPENVNHPELIKVEKISPRSDLFALTNRMSSIEEKLSKFISDTTNTLENLVKRIHDLESKVSFSNSECDGYAPIQSDPEPPRKKVKIDDGQHIDDLITNDNGYVVVYTDGACTNNGKNGAKAGIGIWFNENHPLNISAPVQGPATNNTAEIQAARVAIVQAHHAKVKKLNINTDSQFVISCITKWIHKWKKNQWQLRGGGPVKNKEELVKLDNALQLLQAVEWSYVTAHQGIKGNEMADKLAREGAKCYKTNVTYSRNADESNVQYFSTSDNL